MARLAQAGFTVGDNEPYSGALEGDTLNIARHRRGLPHVLIEMRQDLIGDDTHGASVCGKASSRCWMRRWPTWRGQMDNERCHGRKRERIGSRRVPPAGGSFARPQGCAEYRPDDRGRLLPQLPGRLVPRGGGEIGIALDKDEARELVYGMPPAEWKEKYQKEATPEQKAAFAASQKTHTKSVASPRALG